MSKLTAPITSRAVFFRTFSTFLASGLTLRSALPKAGEHFSPLDVGGVLSSIDQGKSLADSLASTELFSDLEISLLRLAEVSGDYERFLSLTRRVLEKRAFHADQVRRRLRLLIITLHIAIVLPCFPLVSGFQADFNDQALLLGLCYFILALGFLMGKLLCRLGALERVVGRLRLTVPIFGKERRLIQMERFLLSYSILLEAGLSTTRAAELSVSVVEDQELKSRLTGLRDYLLQGGLPSNFLRSFLPRSLFLEVRAGEDAGCLSQKLRAAGESLRETIARPGGNSRAINHLVRILSVMMFPLSFGWAHHLQSERMPVPLTSDGQIFRAEAMGPGEYLVKLGRDIGLFTLNSRGEWDAERRSETVVDRLNAMYGTDCAQCRLFKLLPDDIRVGRFVPRNGRSGEIVVFYSHIDDGAVLVKPEILVTIFKEQAEELKVTPATLGCYWRDLTRDILALSYSQPSSFSPLGRELRAEIGQIRADIEDAPTLENLRAGLSKLGASQRFRLENVYKVVEPDYMPRAGHFDPIRSKDGTFYSISE